MKDFIIVGLGFAGISFAHQLIKREKSFLVYDNAIHNATKTAAAVYNPVILKRFTPVWRAYEQIQQLKETFSQIEQLIQKKIDYPMPVYRRLTSVQQQNDWSVACDHPKLSSFLTPCIQENKNPYINADFGLGIVKHTGRIETQTLSDEFRIFLEKKGCFQQENFDYDELKIYSDRVVYKTDEAKAIVFCEGFALKKNPYFNYLPLMGCKGEVLTIKSEEMALDGVLKANGFIIPMGGDFYKVGSTYDRVNLTDTTTVEAKQDLEEKLKALTKASYKVENQQVAVRPTVSDRRPLVGVHPEYPNVFIINGLGTRGSMIAPYAAVAMSDYIFENKPIDEQMNIQRFSSMYHKRKNIK